MEKFIFGKVDVTMKKINQTNMKVLSYLGISLLFLSCSENILEEIK